MGLIVLNYTTNEGFLVPQLYIQVNSIRMLKTFQGPNYGMYYSSLAYKSIEDKDSGASPIGIPGNLANVEQYLSANDFYDQTIFGFAYSALKANWETAGYVVQDYYPQPPTPTTYIYDCSGYNFQGFNCAGYDRDGYDKEGYNKEGYNRGGCNSQHLDKDGNPCPAPTPIPDVSGNQPPT